MGKSTGLPRVSDYTESIIKFVLDFLISIFQGCLYWLLGKRSLCFGGSSVPCSRFSSISDLYYFPGKSKSISSEPSENIARGGQIVPGTTIATVEDQGTRHFKRLQVDIV